MQNTTLDTQQLDNFEDAIVKFLTGLANGWQNGEEIPNLLNIVMQMPNASAIVSQWKNAWLSGDYDAAREEAKEYIDYIFDFLASRKANP
jgi:hypothetical protein